MAALLLSFAGASLGGALLGPLGVIGGRIVGAVAGSVIDRALFGAKRHVEGPRLSDLDIMASTEGAPVPRVYGRARIAGELIWATKLEEVVATREESAGGKGGGPRVSTTTYSYFANFALGLCAGPVARVGRIWADGKLLDKNAFEFRFYDGNEDQLPDPLIEAKEGSGLAPAYRGLAYLVFERMALEKFGNRIPQLSVEVIRPVGRLERMIRAITLIPGATEFGYEPGTVTQNLGPGSYAPENRHGTAAESDWTASLDELQAVCPNLEHVALVVAWFGSDLVDESALVAWDGDSWENALDVIGDITELQNLSLLGVGTAADATNPFAAKLNNALWAARTVAEGGDGNLRYKLSKESAAKTLSLLMQNNYSGRAEIGLTGDDDLHFKVSPDGSSWIEALRVAKADGALSLGVDLGVAHGGTGASTALGAAQNLQAGYVLAASAVAVSHTGSTAETALATISVPAGAMGANGWLEILTLWSFSGSSAKTPRIRLGGASGTPFFAPNNITTGLVMQAFTKIHNRNSLSSQIGFIESPNQSFNLLGSGSLASSAINTGGAQDLVISGQLANSGDSITLEAYAVRVFYRA